jgi:hypothetical protein
LRSFKGVAIDPDDPPSFEPQATYLKRIGLLLPGESKRLTKGDWESEAIEEPLPTTGTLSGLL